MNNDIAVIMMEFPNQFWNDDGFVNRMMRNEKMIR
jgi:hypothetical protein